MPIETEVWPEPCIVPGIRLTRDSWNTTIVTQNAREGHPWWSWFREPEALELQSLPPYVDTPHTLTESAKKLDKIA
jgi:hypothetical protein